MDKLSRYRFRYTQILQANDRVIKFINETMGDDSADMKEAQNAVERTWQKLHALESQLGRPLRTSMVTPYPFVMSLLSMVEVPINRFAFELFFLQQPAISNIIALAVGVILIAFAHVIGLLMRRATNYVTIKDRSGLYIGSATAILPSSAIIYFLGLMREQYLKIISADQTTNFADLLNQGFQGVESVGKGIAVVQNIAAINLSSAGMILISINTAIFMLGCFLSFMRHDPNPDYENAAIDYNEANTQLKGLRISYKRRRIKTDKTLEHQSRSLSNKIDRIETQLSEIKLKRDDAKHHLREVLNVISNVIVGRITAYQYNNNRSRSSASPACLHPVKHSEISNALLHALSDEE